MRWKGDFSKHVPAWASRLRHTEKGIAVVEFALCLPFVLVATLTAAELANYTVTKMRVSQLALRLADDGSRIGTGDLLSTKQITEAQINDLMTGADLQGSALGLFTNGKVILTSLEPVANPNTTDRYRIRWQRCRGSLSYSSGFGKQGDTNLTGIAINGQTLKAPEGGAIILAEVAYRYQPLVGSRWINLSSMVETAEMYVRDNREYAGPTGGVGIYNPENITASTCS
ncbi:TadE/TadG family type IV pilus assembly protein [Sphingobium chungbukense]|uniref:Tight adherence protein TadE n=1 Tax=Sphingobium chungbukense TaxID=56193 RepID=A0A0M3AJP5_9SPHN|nr:TadE/TadG family type IV pilus assembly protein [Sphingobium chungbukense]KKW90080.1 tight adherence protein TadE [Sphingobium chungbukense]